MILRQLEKNIQASLFQGKMIILLGARQTGKTTLVRKLLQGYAEEQKQYLNCDENITRESLTNVSITELKRIVGTSKIVVIDEAQRVKNIGLTLKLLIDNLPECQVIVTGSSALELSNQINEPLTGRKFEYQLFPVAWQELSQQIGYLNAKNQLFTRLVFGMYPDVINQLGQEPKILQNLSSSYLYKDLFNYQAIRKPELLDKLLQALAFQVGSEVSYTELASMLGVDKNTIETYINLLEKAFVVFRLNPYSRNLRNELNKKRKIYFYDVGIRNAIIGDFRPIHLRQDAGILWENFIIAEKTKANHYQEKYAKLYFWRTHQQQEIDLIEVYNTDMKAYELKWNVKAKVRIPLTFREAYPECQFEVITPSHFYDTIAY